jgi:hypothetical protein
MDETPVPNKRVKSNTDQDVSEAKKTTPGSQTKRLSHIQVSPRPRSSGESAGRPSPQTKEAEPQRAHQKEAPEFITSASSSTSGSEQVPASQPQTQPQHSQSQPSATAGTDTPSRSFADRVILTPRSIINQLKSLKDYLFSTPTLVLGRNEEKEIDDALFDIRRQVHAAGLRGEKKKE